MILNNMFHGVKPNIRCLCGNAYLVRMFPRTVVHAFSKRQARCIRNIMHSIPVNYFYSNSIDIMPTVCESQLKDTFKKYSIPVVEGHTCLTISCPICNDKKKNSKLYINKATGFFLCDKCRSSGSWSILQQFLSMQKTTELTKKLNKTNQQIEELKDCSHEWKLIKTSCQSLSSMCAEEYENVLKSFSLKLIPKEDMLQLNCFYKGTPESTLYFPLLSIGNHIVGYKSITVNSEKETTVPSLNSSGCVLYKHRNHKQNETAVVVRTIHDLFALIHKRSANIIICLPYDLQTLPQELLPSLETYKKLILWFGNDEQSFHATKAFARKLNEQRCYFVRATELQPTPNVAVDMGYDLKGILKNAQCMWHDSIITFQDIRKDVLSDLQNVDKSEGKKWLRFPTLNRILRGHRRGEFTIITGPTGCGKTTFASEYSLDLAMQGVNTLWGSFEIRNARLVRTMLQQLVGVPLHSNMEHFDAYANEFEKLPMYFMAFHGQQELNTVMDTIVHATYVHDIAHVVIDNVQFMIGISQEGKYLDRFWRQDNVIASFRNFATKFNCHVTAIVHPRKERLEEDLTISSIFGGVKASQEADNVLILQDKRQSRMHGKKFLQIAKNRYSGDLGLMLLEFNKDSLSYQERKKQSEGTENRKTQEKF